MQTAAERAQNRGGLFNNHSNYFVAPSGQFTPLDFFYPGLPFLHLLSHGKNSNKGHQLVTSCNQVLQTKECQWLNTCEYYVTLFYDTYVYHRVSISWYRVGARIMKNKICQSFI